MLLKQYLLILVSAHAALTGAIDLNTLSPDDLYTLGNLAHEEGDFDLSVHLMQMVAPRGRSLSLIHHHALRRMQWASASAFYAPEYWWHNGDLTGKKIFIKHDGGAGDAVQFLRYAKQLHDAGAYVMIETPYALEAIYRSCSYLDRLIPYNAVPAQYDIKLTLSTPTLTYTMRNNLEECIHDVPYLFADPALIATWHETVKTMPGIKIGLCWCSSPVYNPITREKVHSPRSIPLALFEPLLNDPTYTCISLQQGFGTEQIDTVTQKPLVFDGMDTTHGRFVDTMALMHNLDLIITVDTSIAHIAGAMGIPVWIILPKCSDFRWFTERTDSVWYPTMRIFRQKPYEDWNPVLDELFNALKELYHDQ